MSDEQWANRLSVTKKEVTIVTSFYFVVLREK